MKIYTRIRSGMFAVIIALGIAFPALATPALVGALPIGSLVGDSVQTSKQNACDGIGLTTGNGGCGNGSDAEVTSIVSKVINILSVIVGIAAVIMIIIGGFRYVTSGGESSNVSAAKNTLVYAVIGLVVVVLAQFIVHFVLTNIAPGSTK